MTTYAIREEASFAGEWWLPAESGRKIPGTLKWSNNRATLQIHDSFIPLRTGPLLQSSQPQPVIYGTTTDNKGVSVLEASWSHGTMAFGGAQFKRPESFISSLVVIGAHVDKQTLYSEVRVRIPGLQLWLGTGRIDETLVPGGGKRIAGVIYHVYLDSGESVEIPSLETTVSWGLDRQLSSDRQTAISVNSTGHLRIVPKHPQELDWYFAQLQKATILLSFIAGAPMTSDGVVAKLVDPETEVNLLVGWADAKFCSFRNPHEFYLLRGAMGADLGEILQTWYCSYDKVAKPSQLALSVLCSKGLWTHIEFLSLMQALEGFHRAAIEGQQLMDGDAGIEPSKPTTPLIPHDQKPAGRHSPKGQRLGKATLRTRLDELAGRLAAATRKSILGEDTVVPQQWIDTRNYYTHWIPALRDKALDPVGMHYAIVRLRHFLRVLYLDFVGIPQAAIAKALDGTNAESQYLIQHNHPTATFGHVDVPSTDIAESEAEKPNGDTEPPSLSSA